MEVFLSTNPLGGCIFLGVIESANDRKGEAELGKYVTRRYLEEKSVAQGLEVLEMLCGISEPPEGGSKKSD